LKIKNSISCILYSYIFFVYFTLISRYVLAYLREFAHLRKTLKLVIPPWSIFLTLI